MKKKIKAHKIFPGYKTYLRVVYFAKPVRAVNKVSKFNCTVMFCIFCITQSIVESVHCFDIRICEAFGVGPVTNEDPKINLRRVFSF